MVVARGDLRVLLGDDVERALPEVAREGQHVLLVHQREVLALGAGGPVERVADAALHPEPRVDRPLRRDLVGSALAQEPALTGVGALGVLPDHLEVGLRREPEGTQVDVLVQVEAHAEQDPPLHQARRGRHADRRVPHRAQQQGVQAPPLLEHLVGQDRPVLQVAVRAQVVVDALVAHAGGVEHLDRLGHHLGADAVAADHADPVGHVWLPVSLVLGAVAGRSVGRSPAVPVRGQKKTVHTGGRWDAHAGVGVR